MRQMTVQERVLIFSVLAILLVGACVKHFRQRIVPEPLPEFMAPRESTPSNLPSISGLDEDD